MVDLDLEGMGMKGKVVAEVVVGAEAILEGIGAILEGIEAILEAKAAKVEIHMEEHKAGKTLRYSNNFPISIFDSQYIR